jgi:NAD(P)-dependent dehydrogenase (short-subunit alcohol dehydrogenase family)
VKDFSGRVAVITGAASGIGRGLAERAAREGMKLVMSDVEAGALAKAAAELRDAGADVIDRVADVSDKASVEALADAAYKTFGAVHLLCNNAGVFPQGRLKLAWEHAAEDWTWTIGVNLMGVVHGVNAFVPRMLDAGTEGHVVNTASVTGFIGGSGGTPYAVSKFGVVRLSEGLASGLRQKGAPIGVTILAPGLVATRIREAERNRPDALMPEGGLAPESAAILQASQRPDAMTPQQAAAIVFDAVREDRFYAFTSDAWNEAIILRNEDILARRYPSSFDILKLLDKERDDLARNPPR